MPHSPKYRRILHRMGYYSYQQGLIFRHLNQDNAWDSHLGRCRRFILKAVNLTGPDTITVLGSGWLMELPLAELAEKVRQINLIDIVHPPEVTAQTAGIKKVVVSEEDISGGLIGEVWNKAGRRTFLNRLSSLDSVRIPDFQFTGDPGLVISLNILTQLETLPEKLLRKKSMAGEDQYISFRKEIQKRHISLLRKYPSVLISDATEILTDRKDNISEKKTILTELPEGKMSDEWIWDFDLTHTDSYRMKSRFRVIARLF